MLLIEVEAKHHIVSDADVYRGPMGLFLFCMRRDCLVCHLGKAYADIMV